MGGAIGPVQGVVPQAAMTAVPGIRIRNDPLLLPFQEEPGTRRFRVPKRAASGRSEESRPEQPLKRGGEGHVTNPSSGGRVAQIQEIRADRRNTPLTLGNNKAARLQQSVQLLQCLRG